MKYFTLVRSICEMVHFQKGGKKLSLAARNRAAYRKTSRFVRLYKLINQTLILDRIYSVERADTAEMPTILL